MCFVGKYPHAACVLSELLCGMVCRVQMRDAVRGTGQEARLTHIVPLTLTPTLSPSLTPHSPSPPPHAHSPAHTSSPPLPNASTMLSPFAQLHLLFGEVGHGAEGQVDGAGGRWHRGGDGWRGACT
ncbi:hypothetical protein CLOM_g1850 [Closterium sp. NIES-68]|nr:hypothetical protein CLOM_g23542 [Closterium sp. NIES-68]GJP42264.1 hypothetical protein CLOM_g1850 [Closterium sp. NIES-68]GJP71529.1 hypothetical protein CLOP_g2355 [Closterium sp. NIES-67]GJP83470.1 hypothetical protein CLOP_g13616 [Closterium sp. NIES-67]